MKKHTNPFVHAINFLITTLVAPICFSQQKPVDSVVGLQSNIKSQQVEVSSHQITLMTFEASLPKNHILAIDGGVAKVAIHLESLFGADELILEGNRLLLAKENSQPLTCIADVIGFAKNYSEKTNLAYEPACDAGVYVRRTTNGYNTTVELVATKIRSVLPSDYAEGLLALGKSSLSAMRKWSEEEAVLEKSSHSVQHGDAPLPDAAVSSEFRGSIVKNHHLGVQVRQKNLLAGRWYEAQNFSGFYASVVVPELIDPSILGSYPDKVKKLTSTESGSMVHLVAADLKSFSAGWFHGTHHPGVEWSKRAHNEVKNGKGGPDGFDKLFPLRPSGMPPLDKLPKIEATFSGGFQAAHSAFLYGDLAKSNSGHQYGFMESGLLMSTLKPNLATFFVTRDGAVDIKTWAVEDSVRNSQLLYVRQNGVALVDGGGRDSIGAPTKYVAQWGPGNWSGNAESKQETPRSAACIIETETDRFLVFAYFSSATPNVMARVFQAYGCDRSIHLDMNSAGQAYFALSKLVSNGESTSYLVEPLVKEMAAANPKLNGKTVPRYLVVPDYKDAFYLYRK
ncbi:MAG: hypothetical protein COT74_09620 [Bdellovibrionales bacterium CG10_big_fil_rev_8_21_14_0_10_45_34]|nr:MAG: hypothetical protein COT74_09620 [Bdellovibrionales bacterium CG10_big_fil_rev_8_21_14_0_10_45_34]